MEVQSKISEKFTENLYANKDFHCACEAIMSMLVTLP